MRAVEQPHAMSLCRDTPDKVLDKLVDSRARRQQGATAHGDVHGRGGNG